MKDLSHYTLLAEMFRYPYMKLQTNWSALKKITAFDPESCQKLDSIISHFHDKPLSFQQEYYTSTFDVQALCFLDIGFVLFGEDYKRGMFMVNIKKEHEKAGNDCGNELPDHLPNILSLLPKLKDEKLAEELVYSLMIPVLHEMISKFGTNDNIYKGLLEILLSIMEKDYPVSEFEKFDFGIRKRTDLINFPINKEDFPAEI